MILAKDLLAGRYNPQTRAQFKYDTDYYIVEKENMYEDLLQGLFRHTTTNKRLAEDAKAAGYVVKETEYEVDDYDLKKVRSYIFFTKYERVKNGKTCKEYSAEIYLPEPDPQIENKLNYTLVVTTNKGSNSSILLDNMSIKEVKQYIEDAYRVGALFTGQGYISTNLIDRVDIKER